MSDLKQELAFRALMLHDSIARAGLRKAPLSSDSLVIRTDGIGDFVLWLDAAKELRRVAQLSGRLILLASQPNQEFGEALAGFAEVWTLDRARFNRDLRYRRKLLRKVTRRRFAVVFNPISSRDPLIDDAVVRASRAPQRIGLVGDLANARRRQRTTNRWYTQLYPAAPATLMELQRAKHFLNLLGIDHIVGIPELAGTFPNPTRLQKSSYYVIFPVASWAGKGWPIERFRDLAKRAFADTGLRGVVCGGETDRAATASVCEGGEDRLLDFGGKTSLAELIGIIQGARFVLSNDTSAVHIAAAVRVPVIAILGGGHFGRFLPYDVDRPSPYAPIAVHAGMPCFGCNWRCIYPRAKSAPTACVDAVTVEAVWSAVSGVLSGRAEQIAQAR